MYCKISNTQGRNTLRRVMVRPSKVFPMDCLLMRLGLEEAMELIQDSI